MTSIPLRTTFTIAHNMIDIPLDIWDWMRQISRLSVPCNANSESKKQNCLAALSYTARVNCSIHTYLSPSSTPSTHHLEYAWSEVWSECAYNHTINKRTQYMRRAEDQNLLINRHSAIRWTPTRQHSDGFNKMIISNWLKLDW